MFVIKGTSKFCRR